jgi:hypothetical protein
MWIPMTVNYKCFFENTDKNDRKAEYIDCNRKELGSMIASQLTRIEYWENKLTKFPLWRYDIKSNQHTRVLRCMKRTVIGYNQRIVTITRRTDGLVIQYGAAA